MTVEFSVRVNSVLYFELSECSLGVVQNPSG